MPQVYQNKVLSYSIPALHSIQDHKHLSKKQSHLQANPLTLSFAPGDTAVVSSTPDGTGPIVIDNFMTINGVNACTEVADQRDTVSCFEAVSNRALPTGMPIETVLTPIPPIDVTRFIPVGTTMVLFDLRDFGVIAGNTDLFLVTTATVIPTQPPTVEHALNSAMELYTGQLRAVMVDKFQEAFEQQVSIPVLTGLREAEADPATITQVEQQLAQASAERASVAATAVTSLIDGQTLISELQRNSDKQLQEPGIAPTTIEKFVANVGAPEIKINQSINDILEFGFDPEQVEFEWKNISADATLLAAPNPAAPPAPKPTVEGKAEVKGEKGEGGKPSKLTVSLGLEVKYKDVTVSVTGQGGVNSPTGGSASIKYKW
jgi:hypothetical protein